MHEEFAFQTPDWQTSMKSLVYSRDMDTKCLAILPAVLLLLSFLSSILAIIVTFAAPCSNSLWLFLFGLFNLIHLTLFLCSNKFSCQTSTSIHCFRCIVDTLLTIDFIILGTLAITYLARNQKDNCGPTMIGTTVVIAIQILLTCITSSVMCCYSWNKFGGPLGALCFGSLNLNIWDID